MGHFSVEPGILQDNMKILTALGYVTQHMYPAKRWAILTGYCRKMRYLDSTWVHKTTHNMYPAKRWDILTGYCRKMRHLDSTCVHNTTHNMYPAERWVCMFADTCGIERWGKRTATYAWFFEENRLQKICQRGAEGDNSWLSDCAQNCTCTNM